MELGIHLIDFSRLGGPARIARGVSDVARAAEDAGCQHLSVMDHYLQMDRAFDPRDPMLECYSTLAFVAGRTERLGLHVLVTGVSYRHPGLLAKIVATLDVLSGGRAELGIGAAWYEREHRALGVPFPPVAERFERFEEALQICRQMWGEDEGPFHGKHYQLAETICSPSPLSGGRLPIVIGGGGERKTLRLVAQYADGSNLFGSPPDAVAHKLDVLRRHCDDVGRDYDEIRKSILFYGWPDGAGFAAEVKPYADLGVDTVIVMPRGDNPAADVAGLGAEVVPRLAEL